MRPLATKTRNDESVMFVEIPDHPASIRRADWHVTQKRPPDDQVQHRFVPKIHWAAVSSRLPPLDVIAEVIDVGRPPLGI